jgi:hypothetical protein
MARRRPSLPAADASRIVLKADHVGDVDAALRLLGVARAESSAAEGEEALPVSDAGSIFDDDEDGAPDSERDAESKEEETAADSEPEEADRSEAPRSRPGSREGRDPGDEPWFRRTFHPRDPDQELPDLDGRGHRHWSAPDRTMIAYLLAPDKHLPDERVERPSYKYNSVRHAVQHVQDRNPVPDAESWRVARRLSDGGPKVSRKGKIDVRECANRVARAEALQSLPRMLESRASYKLDVLIDLSVARGVFSADVEELLCALRSIGAATSFRTRGLTHRDGVWLAGDGPIWAFQPVEPAPERVWYVLIVGGKAAVPANYELWEPLVALLGESHPVSVVWLGDKVTRRRPGERPAWTAFRGR